MGGLDRALVNGDPGCARALLPFHRASPFPRAGDLAANSLSDAMELEIMKGIRGSTCSLSPPEPHGALLTYAATQLAPHWQCHVAQLKQH